WTPACASALAARPLFDGERAFHAGFAVTGDRAVEGVGAWLEVDRGRVRAVGDQFGLADFFAAGGFDRDVVRERLRILEVDRHFAGLGGGAGGGVGERAVRIGFEFQRRGGAATAAVFFLDATVCLGAVFSAASPARRGRSGVVIATTAAGDER